MGQRHKQEKIGVVTGAAMSKTVVVTVENTFSHPRYKRVVKTMKKFKAHDERGECRPGDIVRIVETRPLSKTKRWRLAEIIERAK
ncbi:MAG: 30S ribosomal protein S17 [Candidatus Abyssobacteria bacterium SURF_5]|uniref:Small ribosomal subunit protein uS17 n=1 Tax=Abyssobacteria bacterium (strain SURF_5) TaxID=2093360 RepID=A0A3A4NX39_ABYX5|nr:MAG: 30S ribosomal protein S17 [Candidatus Abyssubacteria bacterium SURF_5]